MTKHGLIGVGAFAIVVLVIFLGASQVIRVLPDNAETQRTIVGDANESVSTSSIASSTVHIFSETYEAVEVPSVSLSRGRIVYSTAQGLYMLEEDRHSLLVDYDTLKFISKSFEATAPINDLALFDHGDVIFFTLSDYHQNRDAPYLFRLQLEPYSIRAYNIEDPNYFYLDAVSDDGTRAVLTGTSCPCGGSIIVLDLVTGERLLESGYSRVVWNPDITELVWGSQFASYHVGSDIYAQSYELQKLSDDGSISATPLVADTNYIRYDPMRWLANGEVLFKEDHFSEYLPYTKSEFVQTPNGQMPFFDYPSSRSRFVALQVRTGHKREITKEEAESAMLITNLQRPYWTTAEGARYARGFASPSGAQRLVRNSASATTTTGTIYILDIEKKIMMPLSGALDAIWLD